MILIVTRFTCCFRVRSVPTVRSLIYDQFYVPYSLTQFPTPLFILSLPPIPHRCITPLSNVRFYPNTYLQELFFHRKLPPLSCFIYMPRDLLLLEFFYRPVTYLRFRLRKDPIISLQFLGTNRPPLKTTLYFLSLSLISSQVLGLAPSLTSNNLPEHNKVTNTLSFGTLLISVSLMD